MCTELIPVSWQSAHRWLSHKPCGRLPLLSTRPVWLLSSQRDYLPWSVPNYTAWWQRHTGVSIACPRPLRNGTQPGLEPATCESFSFSHCQRPPTDSMDIYTLWLQRFTSLECSSSIVKVTRGSAGQLVTTREWGYGNAFGRVCLFCSCFNFWKALS